MSARASSASVYCVVPPTGVYVREDRCQTPVAKFRTIALRPPIDLMYAAAAFEQGGAACEICDYPAEGGGWAELEARLRELSPAVVVISVTTQTVEADMKAAALAKRIDPNVLTIAKGAHFNVHDEDVLSRHPQLDVALREEIEESCVEIARGVPLSDIKGITWRDRASGRVVRNASRGFTRALDEIPYPARHLTRNELYVRPDTGEAQTTLITNRGCPFHCIYCLANQVAGTANRYRSVENVIAEIRQCVEVHGIRNFLYRSDLFTQNARWVTQLCEAIVDEKLDIAWACNARVDSVDRGLLAAMKRAGCWIIAFGAESGDQSALDRMDKRARVEDAFTAVRLCREAGIKSSVYLLMGLPWDTRLSLEAQIRFAKQLDPDVLEFFYPYPFPGTPLRQQCVDLGLLGADEIPSQSYSEPAFPTVELSLSELTAFRNRGLREFYLRPRTILRTLRSARNHRELANYFRVGMSQLRLLAG